MKALLPSLLKWIGYGSLTLVGAIGLSWVLIPDEALDPEAAGFVAQAAVPPSAKNGSFLLWGFDASPELDPHQVGRQIVSAQDRLASAQKGFQTFKVEDYLGASPLVFAKDTKPLCDVEHENCLLAYQKMASVVDQELAARTVYLERYKKLRNYEEFAVANSKITEETPLSTLRPVLRVSELVNAQVALSMRSNSKQEAALTELAADIDLWRKILRSNDLLITQMFASQALHRKYRLVSEILNAYPEIATRYPALMQTLTKPIPVAEASIVAAVKAEARVNLQFLWDIALEKRLSNRWSLDRTNPDLAEPIALGIAYQPHASINAAYGAYREVVTHLSKSPKEMLESDEALKKSLAERTKLSPDALFYNFAGRFGIRDGYPDMSKYAFRLVDLVGLSRLVDLQRQLITAKIAADKIPMAVAASGQDVHNPYTEKPMQWDPMSKQLSFPPQGKRYANFGFVEVATSP